MAAEDEPSEQDDEASADSAKVNGRWWLKPEFLTAAATLITAVATLVTALNGSGGPT